MTDPALPAPDCRLGYTRAQVEEIIGADRIDAFDHWMCGSTVALCDEHGVVIYGIDLSHFLDGGDPLD